MRCCDQHLHQGVGVTIPYAAQGAFRAHRLAKTLSPNVCRL
jgi:hypothetical protein